MKKRNDPMDEREKSLPKTLEKMNNVSFMKESGNKRVKKKTLTRVWLAVLCIIAAAGVVVGWGMWTSRYPDVINMGTACDMSQMQHMHMSNTGGMCQTSNGSVSSGVGTPISRLQAPQTAAHMAEFTLTAQYAHLPFF